MRLAQHAVVDAQRAAFQKSGAVRIRYANPGPRGSRYRALCPSPHLVNRLLLIKYSVEFAIPFEHQKHDGIFQQGHAFDAQMEWRVRGYTLSTILRPVERRVGHHCSPLPADLTIRAPNRTRPASRWAIGRKTRKNRRSTFASCSNRSGTTRATRKLKCFVNR